MADALSDYSRVWRRKPVLRTIYDDFYDRIVAECKPGTTIEIGGGIGNLKDRLPGVVATDIQHGEKLDCVADAQRLPFADDVADNIVMVDVLHHLEFPILFFREAQRVLRPGGRIVMVEPAITWGSGPFYRLFHQEPVVMRANPLREGLPDTGRDPYEANQAIPQLIATRYRRQFESLIPGLAIVRSRWFSFVVYPLSGGFKSWSLVPPRLAKSLLRLERKLEGLFGRIFGFRMMLVVEKR